jgi:hypothetical protein
MVHWMQVSDKMALGIGWAVIRKLQSADCLPAIKVTQHACALLASRALTASQLLV